jgi:hypothetical protein
MTKIVVSERKSLPEKRLRNEEVKANGNIFHDIFQAFKESERLW